MFELFIGVSSPILSSMTYSINAECCSAECHCAGCRGATNSADVIGGSWNIFFCFGLIEILKVCNTWITRGWKFQSPNKEQQFHKKNFFWRNLQFCAIRWTVFVAILLYINFSNRTARIRQECRRATVLSCHRCIINTGIEKMNTIHT
jgi:hypothetical protein